MTLVNQLVALAALWVLGVETLSRRAREHPRWKRRAFAGLWLSERCGRLARRMLAGVVITGSPRREARLLPFNT